MGIITRELHKAASKHQRLQGYLHAGHKRAMIRSTKAAVSEKARALNRTYNLRGTPYGGINATRQQFKLNAKGDGLSIQERLSSKRGIALRHFGAKQVKRGVSFSLHRGKRTLIRSAFIATSIGGGVYQRTTKSRLPIKQKFGPGLATMADDTVIRAAGEKVFFDRIQTEVRKEEARAFKRAGYSQ